VRFKQGGMAMIIGGIEYDDITITDNNGNVFAVISDTEVVELNYFHVLFDVGEVINEKNH